MQKIKYISNRDLLLEIQRSKASFCSFTLPEYANYDVIVSSVDDITPSLVTTALQAKAIKRAKTGEQGSDSVVFRVMCDVHLPLETDEKRRKKSSAGEWVSKTNFSPFQHFIYDDNTLIEVGRSHWRGDLDNGVFSTAHGKISDRLAGMFMLMVDRYSRGGSWRGYCIDQNTEALTQRGWLGVDDITTDDIILSYDDGKLKWSKIKSIFRDDYDGKMFHLTVTGMDALVTPGHKFVTDKGMKEVELLVEKDRLILIGDAADDGDSRYSDEFVELIGWAVTEGNYYEGSRHYTRVTIYQNEGVYADRIRTCLAKLGVSFSEYSRIGTHEIAVGNTQVQFTLTKEICLQILAVAPDRVLSMPFILSLSQSQRELLINTMIDGDGWRTKAYENYCAKAGYRIYGQKDKGHINSFLALCTLAGHRTSTHYTDIVSFGKPTSIYIVNIFSKTYDRDRHSTVENIDFHGGKRNGRSYPGRGKHTHPNEPTIDYKGRVWCPETEYGSFMARRNGKIYLTSNSYVDEMRCHALLQLSQVGLQFDESRSDNPFSFYTQIVKNCLAHDVMILTREYGSVAIGDVAEQDVTLLDGNGDWLKCHIYDYGIQETVNLSFFDGVERVSIRSTMDHGWVQKGTKERIDTKDIIEQKNIISIDDLLDQQKQWDVYPETQNFERRMERVYCPSVPTTQSFSLASGIHSRQCFRRILNLEKRNQDIRDDLLLMSGAQPSYTRQIDNEFDQRDEWQKANSDPTAPPRSEPELLKKRRGRKPRAVDTSQF